MSTVPKSIALFLNQDTQGLYLRDVRWRNGVLTGHVVNGYWSLKMTAAQMTVVLTKDTVPVERVEMVETPRSPDYNAILFEASKRLEARGPAPATCPVCSKPLLPAEFKILRATGVTSHLDCEPKLTGGPDAPHE